eukprot:scaffold98849_cov61-Phaeocystis_antarctica.AAC.1
MKGIRVKARARARARAKAIGPGLEKRVPFEGQLTLKSVRSAPEIGSMPSRHEKTCPSACVST